jgi:AcrR family transcriptional regulator
MERRTELLRAAARVYAKHGYRGSTTRRIADEAGVNEVTIFRQFGSKDALMHEAIATCGGNSEAPELPLVPGDPVTELSEWSAAIMQQLRQTRELIRRCMSERDEHPAIASASSSTAPRASLHLRAYLQRLQDAGIVEADVDVKAASAMLMGALFSDAMGRDWMSDVFPATPKDAAGLYTRMMLRAAGVTDAVVGGEQARALFTDVT